MSTEGLDQPVRTVSPQLWAGLAALVALAAVAAAWGFLGNIPERVSATGVLVGAQGVRVVEASAAGSVTSVLVPTGGTARAGAPLAVIAPNAPNAGASTVRSPVAGTVVDALVAPGTSVLPGTPVALVAPAGPVDRAVLFLAAAQAAGVQPGDVVTVGTAAAVVAGRITSVDPLPLSSVDVAAQFGTDAVPGLAAAGAPVVEVVVALDAGPAVLAAFQPVDASVLVGTERPLQALLG